MADQRSDFRLETPRLALRDWREADWEPFFAATNTPAVMRWLGGVMDDAKMAATRERLERYRAEHGHTFWVVERREDGAILGFCGLKRCNAPGGPVGEFEIGWRLREEAWGHGYAREAAEASLDVAFNRFAAPLVIALTVRNNRASWGLMERLGMVRRSDLDFEEAGFDPDDPHVIVYAIDRAGWESRDG
ncbi:GNAT family N-acetyltransferase [Erythrobacter sp. HL-111]|uniref:GNAT family N-acetyltransferase n=1 Tax=Erythrobacter sp. HL-111 TaxID=1798193 RepID=UPI0006D94379|nr:GNAT family N-acetyltransferase [Erythrobacter sp. HL-111]KPP90622.1 MAG: acetyltransferase [Erythrobacteraceae bacterium HL-111]SDS74361.1 Protein N-acetyltransferase, RimJ/RimL family [Erythrobacter sp. HL-111]